MVNRFPRFLGTILIGYAAIVAAGCSQTRGVGVLIYSDHTPGSLAYYEVERRVAVSQGHAVTTVTEVPAFELQLATGGWEYVVVVARYASGEPAYADELRDYANDGNPVDLLIWHDNGTNPGNDTAVMGTTTIASWSRGRTTVAYAKTTGVLGSATTSSGLNFPDFSGIPTVNPAILVQASPEEIQGLSSNAIIAIVLALLTSDCLEGCLNTWNNDNTRCEEIHETQSEHCESQHPVPPPENMDDLNECLDTANDHNANCRSSASFSYRICVGGCGSGGAEQ